MPTPNKTEQMKAVILVILAESGSDGIHAVDLFRQVATRTGDDIDPFFACAKLGYDPDDLIALAAQ